MDAELLSLELSFHTLGGRDLGHGVMVGRLPARVLTWMTRPTAMGGNITVNQDLVGSVRLRAGLQLRILGFGHGHEACHASQPKDQHQDTNPDPKGGRLHPNQERHQPKRETKDRQEQLSCHLHAP